MGSPCFRFKQFTIWHDRCAMKVGTDGVLLGAWCPLSSHAHTRVLDIGTGSGLIALMLAQRITQVTNTGKVSIDAIDIDADAVNQAKYNFEQAPFTCPINAWHTTLQEWQAKGGAYDLIVSNPPYFQDSLKNPNAQRATARHTDSLSYNELIIHSARLLRNEGTLALVLPFEAKETIIALAAEQQMQPTHIANVYPKPGKPAKRVLIALKKHGENRTINPPVEEDFYIESSTSPRSEEYAEMTQDFYL